MSRSTIVASIETALGEININNGYSTDFNGVLVWDNLPTEYSQNAIYLKDTREKYEKQGAKYTCTLRIEIIAIAIETSTDTATKLGNLALADLIKAVCSISHPRAFINLASADKWIETKGKTACQVELKKTTPRS
ncbi:MAG: hypothetical protein HC939_13900 [Pleurocapsa sp. SU_5_0]|nr:hypothetical protein [Pleurocapsa sp. SU_5_0]NJO97523.1 hypothetical protein [Pleurocapsa sp. CRU_1_2]NJR47400.1 hypothetical protein [Hyellaceae cyanobacterium CSU_1_1]